MLAEHFSYDLSFNIQQVCHFGNNAAMSFYYARMSAMLGDIIPMAAQQIDITFLVLNHDESAVSAVRSFVGLSSAMAVSTPVAAA